MHLANGPDAETEQARHNAMEEVRQAALPAILQFQKQILNGNQRQAERDHGRHDQKYSDGADHCALFKSRRRIRAAERPFAVS